MVKNFTLYNTQTKQVEQFKPITEGKIGLYVCGITPYELSHIGHARCSVLYDTFVKFLRSTGWDVKYVQNYTDIDDKIIKRSLETGVEPLQLALDNINAYEEDMAALNVTGPDVKPKVSTHIAEIIDFVQRLEDKGFTYIHPNGDVMYDTEKFEQYGCLSHRDLDEQIAGIRITDEGKKNSEDFVLWKMAKESENIAWESPWGKGRPGWHIECSAMADKHLGAKFDIHGGGLDLVFPHHENEVAQSDACHGHKSVNYWMHTALIKVDNEKMSKSLGNFFLIRDALKQFNGEVIRLFLLGTSYTSSLNYSTTALDQAKNGLERLYTTLDRAKAITATKPIAEKVEAFNDHLAQDLNTPLALADVFEVSKELNTALDNNANNAAELKATLIAMSDVLGILQQEPASVLRNTETLEISEDEIMAMIEQRNSAKANKDWATADKIRDELAGKNIILKDGKDGTTWQLDQ